MENREIPSTTPLPGIIKILGEGCNLTASKVYLLAFPVLLDLFLLFGPKLRINEYVQPYLENAFSQLMTAAGNSGVRQLETAIAVLVRALESVNLFGFLQTYPIGISVILGSASASTPLGKAAEIQMNSALQIIPLVIAFIIIGVLLGTIYYALAALAVGNKKFNIKTFLMQAVNVILLYAALVILIVLFSVPYACLTTFAFMTSPLIYQIFMLLLIALACWIVIPLFYIPHGIFVHDLDFPHAVKESFQLASWSGTLTIRFILFSLVLSLGLDMIWTIPNQSSWLILVSIFGHAFVSTALLVSSFILFRELDKWQKENRSFLEWRKANLRIRQILKKEPETHE